jgi:hypothetical protein
MPEIGTRRWATVKAGCTDSERLGFEPEMRELTGKRIEVKWEEDWYMSKGAWRSVRMNSHGGRWWWETHWLNFSDYDNEEYLCPDST